MAFGFFFFSPDDRNKAAPHPKGKIKPSLYHCLSQLNAIAEYLMQAEGGKEWHLGCRARALPVCCAWLRAARLPELLPSPEDPVGSGGTSQRSPPVPGSLLAPPAVTVVLV